MSELSPIQKRVLLNCAADDEIALSFIRGNVISQFGFRGDTWDDEPNADEATIKAHTLSVIKDLLEMGLIEAYSWEYPNGQKGSAKPGPSELVKVKWSLGPGEIIQRISAEWDALGRRLNVGGIVSFVATGAGEVLAATLVWRDAAE